MGPSEQPPYAIFVTRGTDDVGAVVNALRYTLELADHDHSVQLYFDGAGTKWPATLVKKHGHPGRDRFVAARERGLIGGACGFCADKFDATDGCESAGVTLLGSPTQHGPDVGELVSDGTRLLTL